MHSRSRSSNWPIGRGVSRAEVRTTPPAWPACHPGRGTRLNDIDGSCHVTSRGPSRSRIGIVWCRGVGRGFDIKARPHETHDDRNHKQVTFNIQGGVMTTTRTIVLRVIGVGVGLFPGRPGKRPAGPCRFPTHGGDQGGADRAAITDEEMRAVSFSAGRILKHVDQAIRRSRSRIKHRPHAN